MDSPTIWEMVKRNMRDQGMPEDEIKLVIEHLVAGANYEYIKPSPLFLK